MTDRFEHSSDVAFSATVKSIQRQRGSRSAYERMERGGGFETLVTDELRGFLRQIDTAFLATASADGQPYVQHRGGPRGFIRAIDDRTLAFVDLVGNRQFVSTGNLADNDRVCLFLIDYAHRRRVKVWGHASVVPASDEWLAKLGPIEARARPEQVIAISVSAWDVNCPQHIPQKLDAEDVGREVARLKARIAELEARLLAVGA